MSGRTTDRRVLRTKRMIRDALTELMEKKGFERITVSDITEKADINRGTFYLHYRDKYDLLEQSEDELIRDIEKISLAAQNNIAKNLFNNRKEEFFPFMEKLFEYIHENYNFFKIVLGPNGDPSFQVKLKEVMRRNIIKNIMARKGKMLVPTEYLAAYVCSAHLGVIQHWLESGMEKSPREMSVILSRMTLLGPGYAAGLVNTAN